MFIVRFDSADFNVEMTKKSFIKNNSFSIHPMEKMT